MVYFTRNSDPSLEKRIREKEMRPETLALILDEDSSQYGLFLYVFCRLDKKQGWCLLPIAKSARGGCRKTPVGLFFPHIEREKDGQVDILLVVPSSQSEWTK